jgi:hypothetical protein
MMVDGPETTWWTARNDVKERSGDAADVGRRHLTPDATGGVLGTV